MSIISNEMRFLGVNSSLVNLIEKKDSTNNDKTEYYSLDDIRGYKVYTALLTQSGEDNQETLIDAPLTIGVTYKIGDQAGGTWDFTNVGAPNNDINTYFVATGTTPNSWGNGTLIYNSGAPVVTVLENTIGNVWFTYSNIGEYNILSDNLFTDYLTYVTIGNTYSSQATLAVYQDVPFQMHIETAIIFDKSNGVLGITPIEIRVYN
jgi:hypothetical protein